MKINHGTLFVPHQITGQQIMSERFSNVTVIDTTKGETTSTAVRQQFDSLSPSILLSIAEASAVSRRSRASIYRHFKAGELTLVKVGNSTRVRVSELRRLIRA